MAGKKRDPMAYSSGITRWAKRRSSGTDQTLRWHGFPMLHKDGKEGRDRSYCGEIVVEGRKRAGAPPRHDPICERCAAICGFIRRPGRKPSGRGSRRLGTVMERLERAVDRLERWLDGNAKRADL